jgi:hypothetical protein
MCLQLQYFVVNHQPQFQFRNRLKNGKIWWSAGPAVGRPFSGLGRQNRSVFTGFGLKFSNSINWTEPLFDKRLLKAVEFEL